MKQCRHYNLDAYRNISDLKNKVQAQFDYNNLLLTCYDACILLLHDIYQSVCSRTDTLQSPVNVESLVFAIDDKKYGFANSIKYYDRLYHTYCLVYEGYLKATATDVNSSIDCLISLINYYIRNIPLQNLIQLYNFIYYDRKFEDAERIEDAACRDLIANALELRNIPIVTY